jgi:hypothetical protein
LRTGFKIALSLGLTALFLHLFLRNFEVAAAWESLRTGDGRWIAAGVVVNLAGLVVRAWRWRYLMAPVRRGVGMYNLSSTTFIGYMVSFLVPFRIGEVVRPVLLARRERVSVSGALATVAVERVLDAITILGLYLLFLLSAHGSGILSAAAAAEGDHGAGHFLRRAAFAGGLLVVVALPLLLAVVYRPGLFLRGLHRLHGRIHAGLAARIIEAAGKFVEGLGVVKRGRDLLPALGLSILTWLTIDLNAWVVFRAFGLPLRFLDTFLFMVPHAVGIAVPTPGGVGAYEYLAQVSLSGFWNVAPARAAAVALTLHAAVVLPIIAVGLLFMWRDGLHAADVRGLAARATPPGGGRG